MPPPALRWPVLESERIVEGESGREPETKRGREREWLRGSEPVRLSRRLVSLRVARMT
jgi:hypothetical protein